MKNIVCSECDSPVSSQVPEDTVFRGYALCPECLELIPDNIADAFFSAANIAGEQRKALFLNGLETK